MGLQEMAKYSDTYGEPAAWLYKGCSGNSESQGYWENLQFFNLSTSAC